MSVFDTGIRPAIDDYLAKEAARVRDYGEYWSASSAGYCMRKVIFERLGVPPVNEDPRKQRVFSAGDIFHSWAQDITKNAGLSIASEVELLDERFKIRGHFDDLIKLDNHLILYDYKTKHSKWFEYVKDSPISHYHRYQLGTYMLMLRREYPDLAEARILSISKDDLRMHEQQLLWSAKLEEDIITYWTELNKYWKAKKIPECTCALYEVNKKTGLGFMADPRYNPYYYNDEPCSLDWYESWKNDNQ